LSSFALGEGWVVENLEKMENKKEMRNWLNEFNDSSLSNCRAL
jgi:hypothetical protein